MAGFSAPKSRALERLTSMSLPRAVKFFSVKLFKAYDSGAFEWNDSFLPAEVPRRGDSLSLFLRSIYDGKGQHNHLYLTLHQILWFALLLLCACGAVLGRKRHPVVPVLGLTLLGLSAYLLLFEVWPRYLFLYAPFFVILAVLGLRELCGKGFAPAPGCQKRFRETASGG